MTNYARNIYTGDLFFFSGRDFNPKNPSDWAVYRPLPNPEFNIIGEDPDVYALRQLAFRAEGALAKRINELLQKHYRAGFTPEERAEIERLTRQ